VAGPRTGVAGPRTLRPRAGFAPTRSLPNTPGTAETRSWASESLFDIDHSAKERLPTAAELPTQRYADTKSLVP
jgi:hypothetical protein